MQKARLARSGRPVVEHGRHIYAYCHIRTSQVVYSLSRILSNNDALRQLPDLGANNKPPSLRRDLWRPYFTLILPPGPSGLKQGLHAYKQLREYRRLHETSWTPSPLLARPYDQDEIALMQDRLDAKGGSKIQTVWDVIKREKKKMRVRTVQDQKANSVADLAAVLLKQDEMGVRTEKEVREELERGRRKTVEEMILLDREAKEGGLLRLEEEIARLERLLAEEGKSEGQNDEPFSRTKTKKELYAQRVRKMRMQTAVEALASRTSDRDMAMNTPAPKVNSDAMAEQAPNAASTQQASASTTEHDNTAAATSTSTQAPASTIVEEASSATTTTSANPSASNEAPSGSSQHFIPSSTLTPSESALAEHLLQKDPPSFPLPKPSQPLPTPGKPLSEPKLVPPKRGHLAAKLRRLDRPLYTASSVRIKWANPLDAEYAAEWPPGVAHLPMGFARYTAPEAESEAVVDAAVFKGMHESMVAREGMGVKERLGVLVRKSKKAEGGAKWTGLRRRMEQLVEEVDDHELDVEVEGGEVGDYGGRQLGEEDGGQQTVDPSSLSKEGKKARFWRIIQALLPEEEAAELMEKEEKAERERLESRVLNAVKKEILGKVQKLEKERYRELEPEKLPIRYI